MMEIGKRTLSVLLLHFLSFKIVEAVVVTVYQVPSFCLAAFPNLYGDRGLWWAVYTLVGVGVPVMASLFYSRAFERSRAKMI